MTTPVRPPSDSGAAAEQSSAARTLHALATLSTVHNALQTARDEHDLLTSTCAALVDTAGYLSAWYVRPADEGSAPQVTAHAGRDPEEKLLARLPMPWTPAWREEWNDDPPLVQDAHSDTCCCLVAPVRTDDGTTHALVICSDDPDRFDVPTRELARLVTDHLGIEISLRTHAEAEAASVDRLAAHNVRLRATLDAMLDPFVLFLAVRDEQGTLIDLKYAEANEAAIEYNHLTREQMIGARLLDLFPGQLENGPLRLYFQTIDTGEPTVLDDYAYPHEILGQERRYDIRATKAGDGLALTWRDVTDRHRAATRLSDSERLYRLLAENSSEVIMLSEDSRTISWVSESSEPVLGYVPDDLVGHSPTDFLHPDDVSQLVDAIVASESSGEVARVRSRWRLPDGSYCWVESAGRPMDQVDDDESTGRVISIHRVDEQVHAEEELAAREQLYRLLAENTSDAVLYTEDARTITWASESAENALGYSPTDLAGREPLEFVHPDDVPGLVDAVRASIEGGQPARHRIRWRLPHQSYCWIEIASQSVPGSTARVVAAHRVDEQVHAEKQLADRDRLYRLLAENSSDVVILVDAEFVAEWVSPSAGNVLGWRPGDMLGQRVLDRVHPDDVAGLQQEVTWANEQGRDSHYRYRWRKSSGTYLWMDGRGRHVELPDGRPGRVVRLRDIDNEVRAEEDLAESERLYRRVTENASDATLVVAADGRIAWTSDNTALILGWRPDELVGQVATDFAHPDDVPSIIAGIEESNATGEARWVHMRWRLPDGIYSWVEAGGSPIVDEEGAPARVVSFHRIDEQVRAQQELERSERMYRLLAENSTDVILLTEEDRTVIWASPATERTLGWTAEDIVGHDSMHLIHPDDAKRVADEIEQSNATGTEIRPRFRFQLPDGGWRWLQAAGRPFVDPDQKAVRRLVTLTDIDEQVAAETRLAEREELFRLIAENSRDIVMLVDATGVAEWVSPSVETTLGWTPDEWVGHTGFENIHPDDVEAAQAAYMAALESGQPAHARFRIGTRDGDYRWVDAVDTLVPGENGEPARRVARLSEIDDQVRAEQALSANEHLYQMLTESSSDVALLVDSALILRSVSPAVVDLLGWVPEDMLGHPATDYIHPEDVKGILSEVKAADAEKRDSSYRYRWQRSDGSYRWVEGRGRLVQEPDGFTGRVVHLRDIEDQVAAERELEASEELFRLIAENSSDVVILSEADTTAVWVSPSVTSTLGWDPEDLIGRPAQDYMHPDDWSILQDRGGVDERLGKPARYRLRRRDGSWMWVEALPKPVPGPSEEEPRLVIRLRDIDEQVHAEELRDESEQLYRLMAENSNDVVIVTDDHGVATWVSPSSTAALGWRPEDIVGRGRADFAHADDIERMESELGKSIREHRPARTTYRFRHPDGSYTWVEALADVLPSPEGAAPRRVVRLQDVDERVRAQHELVSSERRYRLLASHASDIVWQVDDDGILQWISPSATTLLGWSNDELVGRPSSDLIVDDERRHFKHLVEQANDRESSTGEFRVLRQDGSSVWMQITLRVAREDEVAARIGTLRNIDDEVSARASLDFALRHDQFTGLPTRESILDLAARESGPDRREARIAMLVIGIDLLKDVNDAYGHATGDVVVTTVAARLAQALDRPELLGRGTGDEFIAALVDIQSPAEAATTAERLRSAVHGEIELASGQVSATVSIGIAIGSPESDVDSLLRQATVAMHHAKEHGRDRWTFADPAQADEAAQRMAMESAIHESLDRNEFEPWFQPIVALDDGRLAGYEALVRWRKDDHVLLPDEFLPTAGRTPLMTRIDLSMVEPVVTALAGLPDDIFVAVNVSAPTLAQSGYADLVLDALDRHDVQGRRLHVEVTETLLLDVDEGVVAQMQRLADAGIRWYVDDFGTGYSSIAHIRDLPVSGLKLDKSFTSGIGDGNHTARQLADALIGLANGLGLDSVAEGVETEAEAAYLRTLGWRHAQGWLYGKAAPLK